MYTKVKVDMGEEFNFPVYQNFIWINIENMLYVINIKSTNPFSINFKDVITSIN